MEREIDFIAIDFIDDGLRTLFWAGVKSLTLSRKGYDLMRVQVNRISARMLILLALVALLTVISGYFGPRQSDEGVAAHIFQLSIVALLSAGLLFFATIDWKTPLRSTRILAIPASVLVLAFGALYYLEHYR